MCPKRRRPKGIPMRLERKMAPRMNHDRKMNPRSFKIDQKSIPEGSNIDHKSENGSRRDPMRGPRKQKKIARKMGPRSAKIDQNSVPEGSKIDHKSIQKGSRDDSGKKVDFWTPRNRLFGNFCQPGIRFQKFQDDFGSPKGVPKSMQNRSKINAK